MFLVNFPQVSEGTKYFRTSPLLNLGLSYSRSFSLISELCQESGRCYMTWRLLHLETNTDFPRGFPSSSSDSSNHCLHILVLCSLLVSAHTLSPGDSICLCDAPITAPWLIHKFTLWFCLSSKCQITFPYDWWIFPIGCIASNSNLVHWKSSYTLHHF